MMLLKELSEAFAPSGFGKAAGDYIAGKMKDAGFSVTTDALGSVICHKAGKGKKLLLTAFFDEPGFIVTDAKPDGTLCLRPTGGEKVAEGDDFRVVTESGRVGLLKKEGSRFSAFIGEGTRESALCAAPIGSYLVFDSELSLSDFAVGKALASRSGAAALILSAEEIQTENDLYVLFASSHFSLSRGAVAAEKTIAPDEVLALGYREGSGVFASAMDKKCIGDSCVRNALLSIDPSLEVSVTDTVDSDVWAFPSALRGALLIGVESVGTGKEKVRLSDIERAKAIIKKFAERG